MVVDGSWWTGGALVVLAWHNVEGTWQWPAPAGAGAAGFRRQMRALRAATNVVPLDEALQALSAGRRLPPRAVAITFDDGYRDNLDVAVPILRELGLPATVFLVPDLLDGNLDPWWERLAWAVTTAEDPLLEFEGGIYPLTDERTRRTTLDRLQEVLKRRTDAERRAAVAQITESLTCRGPQHDPRRMFLDWEGARALVRAGIGIGSHTTGHAILARETPHAQREDLIGSRRRLQDELDLPIDVLAYPNGQVGDYSAETIAAARAAGYSHSVTAWGLVNGPQTEVHEIRRRLLSPTDPATKVLLGIGYRTVVGGGDDVQRSHAELSSTDGVHPKVDEDRY
ncbi:Polysaccharide deacetylase [Pseudonocardia thermophila]|uniref:Polysaccharide deacetylase n=1 Tax=Pseudonocardia thermophila TaxID=1848 RepID=A0A1M6YUD6_PSETH|nr:Polysaccharide deacetylase [Pseudonocardia thermophila]